MLAGGTHIDHADRLRAGAARRVLGFGSRRWRRHARKAAALNLRRADRRKDGSRQIAAKVVSKGHRAVAAEDLNVRAMTASAHPGANVAAKRGLNRALGRATLARLHTDLERACLLRGVAFTKVPPQGTSTTCHACGARGQRETQARFDCPCCGLVCNADWNAAVNVRDKAWERRQGLSPSDGQGAGNASARREKLWVGPSRTNTAAAAA